MRNKQQGFTILELVVSLAILATIAAVSSGAMYQTIVNVQRNSHHLTAVLQVQNSGYAVMQDVQRAQQISADNLSPSELLVLNHIGSGGDAYSITYSYTDVEGETYKNLLRYVSINGVPDSSSVVGQYIDPSATSCVYADGVLTFTVTAAVGGSATLQRETRTSQFGSRPG